MKTLLQRLRKFFDFDSQTERRVEQKAVLPQKEKRFACPCCGYPTLCERGAYEICKLCFWEDDGQNDANADEVLPGPNQGYSLTEARRNFERYLVMYPPEEDPRFEGGDNEKMKQIKRALIAAFDKMLSEPPAGELNALWQEVYKYEKALRDESNRRIEEEDESPASKHLQTAQKILDEGDAQEALGALAAGFSADVSYKPLYELAVRCLRQLGAEDEANFYQTALADFENPDAFYILGYFYADSGHSIAVPFLERSRQLAPNDSKIAYELALAYIATFRHLQARDILSGIELNNFWHKLLYYKCSLLCGETKGIREFVESVKEDLLDVPFDAAQILRAVDELDESERRFSALGRQPQAIVRDWRFIQYGAAVLDYFDERVMPEGMSVAGGRYVYQVGSNSHIAGILRKLKRFLEELNRSPQFVCGLPDRDSEIVGRAAAEILKLPFLSITEEDAFQPHCLVVAADNRFIGLPTPLETIYAKQTLFGLNLDWLSFASVTPDVAGLMSQDYVLPWNGGAMQLDENGEMNTTPADDRPAELIALEIASAEPEQDSGFAATLDFYKSQAALLKGGKTGGDRRLLFRVDSPVPGAFFS